MVQQENHSVGRLTDMGHLQRGQNRTPMTQSKQEYLNMQLELISNLHLLECSLKWSSIPFRQGKHTKSEGRAY